MMAKGMTNSELIKGFLAIIDEGIMDLYLWGEGKLDIGYPSLNEARKYCEKHLPPRRKIKHPECPNCLAEE
jgi:hypothetical protein